MSLYLSFYSQLTVALPSTGLKTELSFTWPTKEALKVSRYKSGHCVCEFRSRYT